jgi:hypothetical protein
MFQLIMLKLFMILCKNSTQEEIDAIKEKVEKEPFKYAKKEIEEN